MRYPFPFNLNHEQRPPRRTSWAQVCLLVLTFLSLTQLAQAELVHSKSRRFRIPFQFDAAELKRLGTKEVQLFVSRDNGESWSIAQGVSPDTGKFTFEADDDGVYWFSVKTVAASGLIYPAGPHQAGLQVLVDSTPPQIELQLEEVESGRVKLTWLVRDPFLDLDSLKLEFREASDSVWSVVAVRAQTQGQTTWTSTQGGTMEVRGQIADVNGNIAEAVVECTTTTPMPRNDRPEYGKPFASNTQQIPQVTANGAVKPATLTPRLTSTPGTDRVAATPTTDSNSATGLNPSMGLAVNDSQRIHGVNSATFRIGYSLDGIGPSGVKQVDLYITEDDGKKWFHYGQDPDRVSPMEVTVPHDGEFGLAFRVTNGLGRVAIPPQPDTAPDVRILVDRTAPVLELKPLEYGQDLDQNKVVVSWAAKDTNLGTQPISIFYALSATGPWESIQGTHPNTGRFTWPVPETLNQPFFIRLDVKDNAGNITRAYSEKPFIVDRALPQARITEVEPLTNSR